MRYRIADKIIFDPEERTLAMENDGDAIQLPIPACRLLELMLQRKEFLHERDELLREVWDKYGLKSSGSNLNQYISLLRRSLSAMGCEDFFITVPKVGFKINPAIDVFEIEDQPDAESAIGESVSPPQTNVRRGRFRFSAKLSFLFLALILTTLSLFFYKQQDVWQVRQVDPSSSQLEDSCRIIYLNKISSLTKTQINTKAMEYLKERGLKCSGSDILIASVVDAEGGKGISRSFLSLCREDLQGKIVDCNSLYSRR